jgi:HdeA/HdeB family protein
MQPRPVCRLALSLLVAAVSLAAETASQMDAANIECATYQELGKDRQKRILGFLQGYAHREIDAQKVGPVGIGVGLNRVLDACAQAPDTTVFIRVKQVALGEKIVEAGDAGMTRAPTEITCKEFEKLNRDDRRLTMYWLDGYSRKLDTRDANQSVVDLERDPEVNANQACAKRGQGVWSAVAGSVRSVKRAPKTLR